MKEAEAVVEAAVEEEEVEGGVVGEAEGEAEGATPQGILDREEVPLQGARDQGEVIPITYHRGQIMTAGQEPDLHCTDFTCLSLCKKTHVIETNITQSVMNPA